MISSIKNKRNKFSYRDVNDTYDSFSVIYDDDPVFSVTKLMLVFELQN